MQINLTVGEIKRIIGVLENSDDSFFIENLSSLENAKQSDIAIVLDKSDKDIFGPVSLDKIKSSNAGIIISKKEFGSKEFGADQKYILVKDPLLAFQKIVNYIETKRESKSLIDASAVISKMAILKESVSIGASAYVGENVIIGSNVKIYPGAKILNGSIIGDNSIIHSGAVIGSDGFGYQVTKDGLQKIPQIGIVKIGTDVEIGANVTIDRAAFDETYIGNGVKLDNAVHVAHNVFIGDNTVILAQTGIGGSVKIGFGCMIGGQVAIRDHVEIGNNVKIVSKSGVMGDIKDNQTVAGLPTIPFSQWKRICVMVSKLPDIYKDFMRFKSFMDKRRKKSFLRKLWESVKF